VTYVGPNPAVNGYVVSDGKAAGATSRGAVFVVRSDSAIQSPKDFAGKKFASPQLGNTQDISLRKYLLDNGYKTTSCSYSKSVKSIFSTISDFRTYFCTQS
jgi:NitT/TauT family transport system substrate-binding protein